MESNEKSGLNLAVVIWRFSIVIYVPLTILLMLTYMPIKWIVTGRYWLKKQDEKLLYIWGKNIGI